MIDPAESDILRSATLRAHLGQAAQYLWWGAAAAQKDQPTMERELRSMGKRVDELLEKLRRGER